MNSPEVSIIMPAYNAEKYIQAAIDSVIGQKYVSWELLIINDGSTDSTRHIIERNLSDNRIKLINQENKKQAAARNNGIQQARGTWIAFLDADDLWTSDKLLLQMANASRADVLYSCGTMFRENENSYENYFTLTGHFSAEQMFQQLLKHNHIPLLSVLFHSKWIKIAGLQDEAPAVVGCEDYDYWLKLAGKGATFLGMEEKLFTYRIHDSGTSHDKSHMFSAICHVLNNNLNLHLKGNEEVKTYLTTIITPLAGKYVQEKDIEKALSLMNILNKANPGFRNYLKSFILRYSPVKKAFFYV